MKKGLGKRINQIRCEKKISQTDLAYFLGVSQKDVSRWETGEVSPSVENIKKLCSFFNISSDYFLELPEFKKIKYVVFDSDLDSYGGVENEEVYHFDTLLEANRHASYLYSCRSDKEKINCHVYVVQLREDLFNKRDIVLDDVDPLKDVHWYLSDSTNTYLDEVYGGFDSDNLEPYFKWLGKEIEFH